MAGGLPVFEKGESASGIPRQKIPGQGHQPYSGDSALSYSGLQGSLQQVSGTQGGEDESADGRL